MHIILFGGFLGSGKTLTMLQVAKYITSTRQETVAIIENEIGAAGIDDKLFSDSGLKVKKLFGGCVCCQITGDLINAIHDVQASLNPDWLLIEMTGLAYPSKTANRIGKYSTACSSFKIVTIVDRGRWSELITMLKPLIIGQVAGSDLIIVNKADVAGEDLQVIEKELLKIDARMKVVAASAVSELPIPVLEEVVCR